MVNLHLAVRTGSIWYNITTQRGINTMSIERDSITGLPIYTRDFIDELDKTHVFRLPSTAISDRELWSAIGQRKLIDTYVDIVNTKPSIAGDAEEDYSHFC